MGVCVCRKVWRSWFRVPNSKLRNTHFVKVLRTDVRKQRHSRLSPEQFVVGQMVSDQNVNCRQDITENNIKTNSQPSFGDTECITPQKNGLSIYFNKLWNTEHKLYLTVISPPINLKIFALSKTKVLLEMFQSSVKLLGVWEVAVLHRHGIYVQRSRLKYFFNKTLASSLCLLRKMIYLNIPSYLRWKLLDSVVQD